MSIQIMFLLKTPWLCICCTMDFIDEAASSLVLGKMYTSTFAMPAACAFFMHALRYGL